MTIVSDTHVSERVPETLASWGAVHDHIARTRPAYVVHLGDLTLEGAVGAPDLVLARRLLDDLPVPWRAVPGNHDIGDNPPAPGAVEGVLDEVTRRRWLEVVGPDRWSLEVGGWRLLAVNAQLFGSGLDAEDEQWDWLTTCLTAGDGVPTALLCHKPTAAPPGEGHEGPGQRFLPKAAQRRLRALLDGAHVPLVVCGHVHQGRDLDLGGRHHLWVPSSWAVLPDDVQGRVGTKRCGLVDLDLEPGGVWRSRVVEPQGLAQLTVTVDLPNPYA